jgi:hypothetical protein
MFERISLIAVAGSHTFWSANGYHAHPEVMLSSSYGANAMYMSMTVQTSGWTSVVAGDAPATDRRTGADPHVRCSH